MKKNKIYFVLLIFLVLHYLYFFLYRHITHEKIDFGFFYGVADGVKNHISPFDKEKLVISIKHLNTDELTRRVSYSISYYLPVLFWIFIPFTFIPYNTAKIIYLIIQHILFILSIYIYIKILFKQKYIKEKSLFIFIIIFLISFFTPLIYEYAFGNINIIILFLISLTIYFYMNNRFTAAGLILSIAFIIKLYPGILILEFIRRKKFKALISFFIATLFIVLFIAFIYGWQIYYVWINNSLINTFLQDKSLLMNQSIEGAVIRCFTDNSTTVPIILLQNNVVKIIIYSIRFFIISIFILYMFKLDNTASSSIFYICLLLGFTILAMPVSWVNYSVIFLLPLIFIIFRLYEYDFSIWLYILTGVALTLFIVDIDYRILRYSRGWLQLGMNCITYGYILLCYILIKIQKKCSV